MTTTECPRSYKDGVEAAERVYRALKLLRGLVQDDGVPRYSVTPGAALNSIIEEDVDPALLFAARNIASLHRPAPSPSVPGEREKLAEKIEDAKPGWLPITGHVVTITLTLNERDRLLAHLRAPAPSVPGETAPAGDELRQFVLDHWDNQDMNHADFRVHAYQIAAASASVQGGE